MPRTPEQRARRAEYQRAYRERNREQLQEYDRNRVRTFTPEQREAGRERQRAYYAANRDRELAKMREYQVQNRDKISAQTRAYRAANRDKIRAQRHADQMKNGAWRRHGLRPEDRTAMWQAQDGRCYLCGEEVAAEKAHIDHDHSCCGRDRSCPLCRRGLACEQCNRAIGLARDDPDRLRRMADTLETAKREVAERMANRETAEQLPLL